MVLISAALAVGAAAFVVWRLFSARAANAQQLWRLALTLGVAIGVVRATLACLGWYVVEHTGGDAQVPGFALAMLAWPEAALLPRHTPGITPASTYVFLYLLLLISSTAAIVVIAALARTGKHQGV